MGLLNTAGALLALGGLHTYGLASIENAVRRAVSTHVWFRRIDGRLNAMGGNMQDEAVIGLTAVLWHVASIASAVPALLLGSSTHAALQGLALGTWGEVVYEVSELYKMAVQAAPYDRTPLLYQLIAGVHHLCAPAFVYVAFTAHTQQPKWWLPMALSGTVLMSGSAVQYAFDKSTRLGRRGMMALYLGGGALFAALRHYCNRELRREIDLDPNTLRGRLPKWLFGWMNVFNALSLAFVLDKARRVARLGV